MDKPADFTVSEDGAAVVLQGDWSAICLGDAAIRLREAMRSAQRIDLREVGRFDTAGALGLIEAADGDFDHKDIDARPETQRLLDRVSEAIHVETPRTPRPWSFNAMMNRLGHGLINAINEAIQSMGFLGRLLANLGLAAIRPHKVRWAAVANLMERAGIDAIPIVVISNFFIGAVIAFLASSMLADFGVQIFSVETVGFGVLREFCIVITAVLVAGRSASSFAAEIGAMKMQQEIDAMQTMGVDPFQAIVLPRFIALVVMIFFLTFLAAVAGLFGGFLVLWDALDISAAYFTQALQGRYR